MRADESILFAVVGMSPAVLTETVWALAHEKNPVVPDRIVVLTTIQGREQISRTLLTPDENGRSGWQRMMDALTAQGVAVEERLKFGPTGDSIRVFTDGSGRAELADIATSQDNEAAADFMLRALRSFTSNPATTVIASIAGGRKTMSALMISCMSLLGRAQDRVCHVLVNPPYDGPLEPPFLFPVKGLMHRSRDNKKYSSVKALIELTDVPFVRMLGWYEDKFRSAPPRYSALVAGVQRQVPKVYPVITLDMEAGRVFVVETAVELAPSEFMVFREHCVGNTELQSIGATLKHYKSSETGRLSDYYTNFRESPRFNYEATLKEDVSRCDSAIRRKLKETALSPFMDELMPKRGKPMTYPTARIKFKGRFPFASL